MLASIFVNPVEKRLRAGWRLLLHAGFFFGGSLFVQLLIGVGVGIVFVMTGGALDNPEGIMAVANHPIVRLLAAISSLVLILISYFIAARWLDRRPIADYGLHFNRLWWADLAFGLFLGAVLMAFIFGVELAAGWITVQGILQGGLTFNFWLILLGYIIVYICVGIYEEMLSRGYQIRNLSEGFAGRLGPRVGLLLAYLLTSSFFGFLHAANPNATLTSTLYLVVAGLFLGVGYLLTGELALPIGLHITWNFFQGNVFGFPVSGMASQASLISIQQGGPDVWTGGLFGPESGLIGLSAIILGTLLIALWVRLTRGKVGLRKELAIYRPNHHNLAASESPAVLTPNEL